MRTKLVTPILFLALVAACGGGTTSSAKPAATNAAASAAPAANGSVDCAKVKAASAKLIVAVQLLAQLRDPAAVESVKSGTIGNLDLDEFLAALKDLHALDGQSSVLGDPKTAIDAYEKAGEAAKVLFATDPVTQDAVDTYNTNVGTIPAFLGHQGAIAGAMDAAGC